MLRRQIPKRATKPNRIAPTNRRQFIVRDARNELNGVCRRELLPIDQNLYMSGLMLPTSGYFAIAHSIKKGALPSLHVLVLRPN